MKKRILLASIGALIFVNDLNAQIKLSEVSQTNINTIADGDNDFNDWFEIRNDGVASVDLNGYVVGKNANQYQWSLPAYNLAPGEHKFIYASGKNRVPTIDHYETILPANDYIVIAKDTALFHSIHPAILNVVGPSLISLGSTEGIILYDEVGIAQFTVNYANSAPWTKEPDGNGKTLELLSRLVLCVMHPIGLLDVLTVHLVKHSFLDADWALKNCQTRNYPYIQIQHLQF